MAADQVLELENSTCMFLVVLPLETSIMPGIERFIELPFIYQVLNPYPRQTKKRDGASIGGASIRGNTISENPFIYVFPLPFQMVISVINQMPNTEQVWSLYIPFISQILVSLLIIISRIAQKHIFFVVIPK